MRPPHAAAAAGIPPSTFSPQCFCMWCRAARRNSEDCSLPAASAGTAQLFFLGRLERPPPPPRASFLCGVPACPHPTRTFCRRRSPRQGLLASARRVHMPASASRPRVGRRARLEEVGLTAPNDTPDTTSAGASSAPRGEGVEARFRRVLLHGRLRRCWRTRLDGRNRGSHGEAGPPADRPPGDRPPGDRPPGDRPPGDRPPAARPSATARVHATPSTAAQGRTLTGRAPGRTAGRAPGRAPNEARG